MNVFGLSNLPSGVGEMPSLTNPLSLRKSQVSLMNLLKYFIISWHVPETAILPEKETPSSF